MADLSITAASVLKQAAANVANGTAGEAITAGQVVYKDTSDGKWKLADNNSATAAVRSPGGIALNDAADGQPIEVLTSGDIVIGATIVAGTAYYLSATAGGIAPVADLLTGHYPTFVGIGRSTTVMRVNFTESGAALP